MLIGSTLQPQVSWGDSPFSAVQQLIEQGRFGEVERIGRDLLTDGRYVDAELVSGQLLLASESRAGRDSRATANAIDLALAIRIDIGTANGDSIVALARRAVAIRRKDRSASNAELVSSLLNLARVLRLNGMKDDAQRTAEQCCSLREEAAPEADPLLAECLEELALHWLRPKDSDRAMEALERSKALRIAAYGPRHPSVATSMMLIGTVHYLRTDYQLAKPCYEQALAIREQALRPGHPAIGRSCFALGSLYTLLDDYAAAQRSYERALAIYVAAFPPGSPMISAANGALATILHRAGDYVAARDYYERAITTEGRRLGRNHPQVCSLEGNYALLLHAMGDLDSSLSTHRRLLEVRTTRGDSAQMTDLLIAIGDLLIDKKDPAAAQPFYEQAQAMSAEGAGDQQLALANALAGLAAVHSQAGDSQLAIDCCRKAIAIRTEVYGPDNVPSADLWILLGRITTRSGDPQGAMTHLAEAERILDAKVPPNSPRRSPLLSAQAMALARLGRFDEALESALAAERLARNHLAVTARGLPERQALGYAAAMNEGRDVALTLLLRPETRTRQHQRQVYDAVIRSRALVLDEIATRHHQMAMAKGEASQAAMSELQAARQQVANLMVQALDDPSQAAESPLLAAARQRAEQAEIQIAALGLSASSEPAMHPVSSDSLARRLARDQVLVSVVLFDRYPLPANKGAQNPGPSDPVSHYAAFVLPASGVPTFCDLGEAAEIDQQVIDWRTDVLASAQTLGGREAELSIARTGERLRATIWDPIQRHLGTARLVFVVPDGMLNLVNLAALNLGPARYVIDEGPILHLVSAERDLVRLDRGSSFERSSGGLLAVGGVDFNANTNASPAVAVSEESPDQVLLAVAPTGFETHRGPGVAWPDFDRIQFKSLPSTLEEARSVAATWNSFVAKASHPPLTGPRPAIVITGAEASELKFKDLALDASVLHIATHGFFLSDRSTPPLGDTRGIGVYAIVPPNSLPSTYLLSGLALAGANRRSDGYQRDDGILTAEEITLLDLSGVEWAVLSACDTGVGAIRAGEGIFGLRRAFHVAGARSVITSLWAVPDAPARSWMEQLYRARFDRRLSTAESVHEATRAILAARRSRGESTHPSFWGGFVAEGDWQ